ncbi:MAG: HipA N-terminal domain-containing protein [Allomuricauda sp.]
MRWAKIPYKGQWTGILALDDHGHYTFRCTEDWLRDGSKPPISLTLPKSTEAYRSDNFFPFFTIYYWRRPIINCSEKS